MKGRERAFLFVAAAVSVAIHASLIYCFLGVSLGLGGAPLFAAAPPPQSIALQIDRDPHDRFVEEDELARFLNPEGLKAQAAERVRDAASELIEEVEPEQVSPEDPDSKVEELAAPQDPAVTPPLPEAAPSSPGPPAGIDATRHLLALAQPSITLPQFVAPAGDVVTLPEGLPPGFGDAFDPGAAGGLVGGEPGSTGAAAGDPGNAGAGVGLPRRPVAPPLPPKTVAKAAAPAVIPDPVPAPIVVPEQAPAVHLDEDFDYKLLTYVPEKRIDTSDGYMEIRIEPRRSLRRLRPLHKDVIYAVDTSSSITSKWIEPVKRGVLMALDALNEGDRFNVVLFNEQVAVLSPQGPVDATPQNVSAAREFLAQAAASGYTDVNRALGRLLVRSMPPDRVYQIVLISDGKPTRGAVDPRSIINLITRENDLTASIYCVGIGDTLNRELLQYLAYRNKGFVVYPDNAWKVSESIAELAGRLRYPIVKDATFTVLGVDAQGIYPRIPRDIYQSEPVNLFGRFPADAQRLTMRLTGVSGPDRLDFTFSLDFSSATRAGDQIMHNWAFWRLHHLYSETMRRGETPELKKQVEDVKRQYKIKTAY
jgi:Mg-chelatase subunit ChlD